MSGLAVGDQLIKAIGHTKLTELVVGREPVGKDVEVEKRREETRSMTLSATDECQALDSGGKYQPDDLG